MISLPGGKAMAPFTKSMTHSPLRRLYRRWMRKGDEGDEGSAKQKLRRRLSHERIPGKIFTGRIRSKATRQLRGLESYFQLL
jgi:hypothetical protein